MSYELHEGQSGTGETTYLVVAVTEKGQWHFIHVFNNKPEAVNWIKWA